MSGPARLTRRSLAAVLAGAAAPRAAQSAQAPSGTDLDEALKRIKQQAETIKEVKLTAGIEPAFRFEP